MNFDLSSISPVVSIVGIVGGLIFFVAYVRVTSKNGTDRAESETIKTLNDLNSAQQKKISQLQGTVDDLSAQVTNMQQQIDDLMKRRTFTDTLLKESLIEYFVKHRDLAKTVEKMTENNSKKK